MGIKTLVSWILVGMLAGLVPFGLIALARSQTSAEPPVHPIQDMFKQQKFRAQRGNAMFADGRAMRPLLPDVTARHDLELGIETLTSAEGTRVIDGHDEPLKMDDAATYQRVMEGTEPGSNGKPAYIKQIPLKVTADFMERGRQRFNIYCAACHGQSGYGDGMVARRAAELQPLGQATGWAAPKNYHTDDMRSQPVGQIFNTATNGARSMPAYAKQISVRDRWAIVAYVKALQRSQHGKPDDVPEAEKDKYK